MPLVLGLATFTLLPRGMFPPRMLAAAVAGFLIAALPRLLVLLTEREASQLGLGGFVSAARDGLATRLAESPAIFAAAMHGDMLYQRYAGELLWPTPWVAPALLAVAAILIACRLIACRPARETEPLFKNARHVAGYLALFAVLTVVLMPELADRHFLLSHYFVVPFIAMPFRLAISGQRASVLGAAALSAFLVFNVGRTAVNFHAAHLNSGGTLSTFQLGRKIETSNHFVRTDLLYEHLRASGVREVRRILHRLPPRLLRPRGRALPTYWHHRNHGPTIRRGRARGGDRLVSRQPKRARRAQNLDVPAV